MSAQLWKRAAKRFWQNWGYTSKVAISAQWLAKQHLESYVKARADLTECECERNRMRLQIRSCIRLLERDLEFGERSAYVEEALELLR